MNRNRNRNERVTTRDAIQYVLRSNNESLTINDIVGKLYQLRDHNLFHIPEEKSESQFKAEVSSRSLQLYRDGEINRRMIDGIYTYTHMQG